MRKKKIMPKVLSAALSAAVVTSSAGAVDFSAMAAEPDTRTAIDAFQNPCATEKPMARMWFPDAYAGIDDNDTVEKQINELAEAGFGGVEVAMLADGASFNNQDAATVGWGTDAWKELLRKVLKAANAIEGGFTVDITLSAHWPLTINTIDPNDEAASQNLVSTYTKVTQEAIAGNQIDLVMPEKKYFDQLNAPFIFKDTLVTSSLVKVASVEDGNIVLDYDSITDVTNAAVSTGETTRAGIPDAQALEELNSIYAGVTLEDVDTAFGQAASTDITEKIDDNGNRRRMADVQEYYKADLTGIENLEASDGDEIQAGDYILLSTYRRGTGQVFSDGGFGGYAVSMVNRCYVPDYFNTSGVDAVTDYWDKTILSDAEMVSLLKENGSSIFEDSIELTHSSSFWTGDLLEEIASVKGSDYSYTASMPVVMAVNDDKTLSFDENEQAEKIQEDYNTVLGTLYEEEHTAPIREWASDFNYTFRAQTYVLTGLDVAGAASTVDIPEGDNASKGDGLRNLAAAVNLTDKTYLSMEGVTGMGNHCLNWEDVLTEVSQNYSDGVNHEILHGTPYSKSYNGYNSSWPGWMAFGNCFSDSYTYRQAYWDDADGLTTFMAKTQAVLQTAEAKIDVAILNDKSTVFNLASGNSFQTLLDNGYSYNILSESLLALDQVTVTDGVMDRDGTGYKALVLNNVSTISTSAMEKLVAFADAGLPIYLYNCDISDIYGTDGTGDSQEAMLEAYARLIAKENVTAVSDQDTLLGDLQAKGIISDASYQASSLETTHYEDLADGTDYYYAFNNSKPNNSGMINPGDGNQFKGSEIDTIVTVKGTGTPYILDASNGSITPVAAYTVNDDGTISMRLVLGGGESKIIAIAEDTSAFGEAPKVHTTSMTNADIVYEDGKLYLKTHEAGTYQVTLSDGTAQEIKVADTREAYELEAAGWNLAFTSFGPDRSAENTDTAGFDISSATYDLYKDPSATLRTTVDFTNVSLGDIGNIEATGEQLQAMGVDSMQNVSGYGIYTKKITLPENWDSSTGAVLKMTYNRDQITEVKVNGKDVGIVSNITDQVDIGEYLIPGGENEISIKVATNLINRVLAENPWAGNGASYDELGTGTGGKPVQLGRTERNANGLNSVTLEPYTMTEISQEIAVTGITLDKTSASVKVGDTFKLLASVNPSDASDKTITWTSSNSKAAAVDSSGNVTAVGEGSAVITAASTNGKSATCKVTVAKASVPQTNIAVTGVSISPSSKRLFVKENAVLNASVTPSNAANKSLSYSSSNSAVAAVDGTGKITAKKAGTAVITAAALDGSKKKATCTITVVKPTVKLNAGKTKLQTGKSTKAVLAGGLKSGDQIAKWSSSKKSVATVNQKGKITAKKAGTATITVTTKKGAKAACRLTVTTKPVRTSKITTDKKVTLKKGKTLMLNVKRTPITATEKISFETSDKKIVTVNKNGKITAKKKGKADITVKTANGKKAVVKVTVR